MPTDGIAAFAALCQLLVPIITLAAYVPQWRLLGRTRSSANQSPGAWATWTVTAGMGFFYAIIQLERTGVGWPLVISAGLALAFTAITLVLVLIFAPTRTSPQITAE